LFTIRGEEPGGKERYCEKKRGGEKKRTDRAKSLVYASLRGA